MPWWYTAVEDSSSSRDQAAEVVDESLLTPDQSLIDSASHSRLGCIGRTARQLQ